MTNKEAAHAVAALRRKLPVEFNCYKPGGPWLFTTPYVREVWGYDSPTAKDPSDCLQCRLPADLYKRLPGGHEHKGTRLYGTELEATKALLVAAGVATVEEVKQWAN